MAIHLGIPALATRYWTDWASSTTESTLTKNPNRRPRYSGGRALARVSGCCSPIGLPWRWFSRGNGELEKRVLPHGPVPCVRRLGRCLPNDSRSRDLRLPATDAFTPPLFVGLQEIVIRRCAADSKPHRKSSILNTKLVGGPGFVPGASRSRSVMRKRLLARADRNLEPVLRRR
jgi:hypothetical protein